MLYGTTPDRQTASNTRREVSQNRVRREKAGKIHRSEAIYTSRTRENKAEIKKGANWFFYRLESDDSESATSSSTLPPALKASFDSTEFIADPYFAADEDPAT